MTASVLKQDPNTKRFKRTLIYFNSITRTHSMQIFGEIAHELCEQGGGAGLSSSMLDSWVSTLDIVTVFPTTVERASRFALARTAPP